MSKQRESNIELLRVIAIFLVLVVHVNMLSKGIGIPGHTDIQLSFVPTITRAFFISVSYICVDVFIIISGWYGVHASLRGLCKLMFMCAFLGMLGYVIGLWHEAWIGFSIGGFVKTLFNWSFPGWFVASYVIMYIFSPVVNAFVERCSEQQVRYVLITFFALEFVYGWIFPECGGNPYTFNGGYSALSLIGLYVLVRYLKVFVYDGKKEGIIGKVFSVGVAKFWLVVWMGIVIIDVILWCVMTYMNIGQISSRIFTYTSPMIIAQSIAMFMCFKNMRLRHNRFINWLGASSLAVLIVHGYLNCEPFLSGARYLYQHFDGILCLVTMFLFMSSVFILAVVVDQVRIIFWNRLAPYVPDIKN